MGQNIKFRSKDGGLDKNGQKLPLFAIFLPFCLVMPEKGITFEPSSETIFRRVGLSITNDIKKKTTESESSSIRLRTFL